MNEEALKKIVTDMIIIMNTTLSRFEIMDDSEEKRALITTYIRTLYNNNFKGQAVRWGVSSAGRLLSRRLPQFDTGGLQRGGGRGLFPVQVSAQGIPGHTRRTKRLRSVRSFPLTQHVLELVNRSQMCRILDSKVAEYHV